MENRVLVADDHPLCREAIRTAMQVALPGFAVDQASTIGEAEQAVQAFPEYRFVVLDLMLPDAEGFSGLLRIQRLLPATPIAIISGREGNRVARAAETLGAIAFLPKSLPIADLGDALRRLARGEQLAATPAARPADEMETLKDIRARFELLTLSQLRIVLALRDGRLNKEIAYDVGLGETTVKTHLAAAFKKLGVQNRTQAVLLVQQLADVYPRLSDRDLPC